MLLYMIDLWILNTTGYSPRGFVGSLTSEHVSLPVIPVIRASANALSHLKTSLNHCDFY